MPQSPIPGYIISLIRHFEDLRDGTHGGSESRKDKETHFEKAVQLLAPIARQVLDEVNTPCILLFSNLRINKVYRPTQNAIFLRRPPVSFLRNLGAWFERNPPNRLKPAAETAKANCSPLRAALAAPSARLSRPDESPPFLRTLYSS